MSYGVAAALQSAVYQSLAGDAALTAMIGAAIYDAVPPGGNSGTYLLLGPEEVRDRSDKTGHGAEHRFSVSVISDATGFQSAKEVAVAVSDILLNTTLTLSRGQLVALNFQRAQARRTNRGTDRRIDLTFVARVEE